MVAHRRQWPRETVAAQAAREAVAAHSTREAVAAHRWQRAAQGAKNQMGPLALSFFNKT